MNFRKVFLFHFIAFILSFTICGLLSEYEARNIINKFLFNGYIPFIIIISFIIITMFFVYDKLKGFNMFLRFLYGVFSCVFLCYLSLLSMFFILALSTSYSDKVIYYNESDKAIIIQYFERGATGNPDSNFIVVNQKDINRNMRKYVIADLEHHHNDFFDNYDLKENITDLPQKIIHQNESYYLKEILDQ